MSTRIQEETDLHFENLEKKAISDLKDIATVMKISSVSKAYGFFKKSLEEIAEDYNDLFSFETLENGDHLFTLSEVNQEDFRIQLNDRDLKAHVRIKPEQELIFFEKVNRNSVIFKAAKEYGDESEFFPELLLNSSFKINFLDRLKTAIYYYSLSSSDNVFKEIWLMA